MKLCVLTLFALILAGVADSSEENRSSAAAVREKVVATTEPLALEAIPVSRSFRCPVVLAAANSWTAATTVPTGMAFAMTSLTLTDSAGGMIPYGGNFRRLLRIVGGSCIETMVLPSPPLGNNNLSAVALNQRKIEFDPPLMFYPGCPFSLDITSSIESNGVFIPYPFSAESLSLVVGGYVLYPGEY